MTGCRLRYGTTRNRLAACIAFISGMLFLLSGYRANIEIYNLIRDQLVVHTARDFWIYAVIPGRLSFAIYRPMSLLQHLAIT